LVAATGEDQRQPSSRVGFSEQEPARLVVRGLDDTAREESSAGVVKATVWRNIH
jgi:hypothetical protein